MGATATASSEILAPQKEFLARFAGTKDIELHDPFWHDFLSFSQPLSKLRPADVEEFLHPFCAQLVVNNCLTAHFGKLLVHVVEVVRRTRADTLELPVKPVNALILARVMVKYFTEHATAHQLALFIQDPPTAQSPTKPVDGFSSSSSGRQTVLANTIQALFDFLTRTEPSEWTYLMHLEAMNLLLVMASTQLTSAAGTSGDSAHPFLAAMMRENHVAPLVVRRLLMHYMERKPAPKTMPLYTAHPTGGQASVLGKMGTAAVSTLLMPFKWLSASPVKSPSEGLALSAGSSGSSSSASSSLAPLADTSILLLLVLAHYHAPHPAANPFRLALNTCRDTDYDVHSPDHEGGGQNVIRVPYGTLFDTIGLCLVDDRSTLLLYSLIFGNSSFLEYVLVRTDLDTVLMPLLEMLYNAPGRTANQIYMLLIILLILSQDVSFNANIHKLFLSQVPWYQERLLVKISLGSLLVVILIRTVKYNLSKLRDVYLHTNCLAILANMAPHIQNLNAYASQRLVSLFDMLARKYMKLQIKARVGEGEGGDASTAEMEGEGGAEEEGTELHIYTDFLRIVLEIVNAILTYALPRNPEVVYALLHRQELFLPFKTHPRFSELLDNIQAVLDYFNSRMESTCSASGTSDLSVEKVLAVVTATARAWRGDGIKLFTELRFTYEEEAHPEEFFVPYVWSLVCAHSGIPWDPAAIALFGEGSSFKSALFEGEIEDISTLSPIKMPGKQNEK